jgi:hypothetical protein
MAAEHVAWPRLALNLLVLRAGNAPDAKALAAAARAAYDDLARVSAPLVGQAGVDALAGRALHLSQRQHSCLKQIPEPDQLDESMARVVACLQQQDPLVATEAAAALFAILIELLVTFIGKPLTTRLLRQAWPDVFVDALTQER